MIEVDNTISTLILDALRANDESANSEGLSLAKINWAVPDSQRMRLSDVNAAIEPLRRAGLVRRYRTRRDDGTRGTTRFRLTRAGHLLAHERDREAER